MQNQAVSKSEATPPSIANPTSPKLASHIERLQEDHAECDRQINELCGAESNPSSNTLFLLAEIKRNKLAIKDALAKLGAPTKAARH